METQKAKYQALFEEATPDASYLSSGQGGLAKLAYDLYKTAETLAKKVIHTEIDTQEERGAIREACLAVYDRLAAKIVQAYPLAGIVQGTARSMLSAYLDSILLAAANVTA